MICDNEKRGYLMKTPEELRADFWKEDELKGSVIRKQYDQIKEVLANNDMDWVLARYNDIKEYAIRNTEYYKNVEVDDFPVVNKASILENYEAHKAREGAYSLPVHISSTSGSTGTPFSVLQDYEKRQRTIADLKVFGERADYPSHERMVFFRGTTKNRTPEQEDKENIYYIDCGNMGNDNLELMFRAIVDKKPRIIFSYSSTLIELAKYIDVYHHGTEFSMVSTMIAGEGLSDNNRLLLENVFGCTVYRRYSDMELGILGQDLGSGGGYFLNWGSYFFECLKVDSDEPAEYGEVGRIVITDLFNKAMPLIRYDTGDYGVFERSASALPIFSSVLGKKMECVYSTSGELISPHKLEILMWGYDDILQWQFVQDEEKKYHFNLNARQEMDCSGIIEAFKVYLGSDAEIAVNYVDEIPTLASNKRRMVVCNLDRV